MKKILTIVLATVLLIGCVASLAEEEKIRIGMIYNDPATQVVSSMANHAKKTAEELGCEATLVYHQYNVDTMIGQIEQFTTADYDAIIILPMNSGDGVEAMQAAMDKGIKVLTFDTIPDCDYTASFTASNAELGYMIGEAAADWAKEVLLPAGIKPVIGVIDYRESEFLTARSDGILTALAELLPEGEVVMQLSATQEATGLDAGEQFLTAYPEMNIVCTINDDSASGVLSAFEAAGKGNDEHCGIFSCDGTLTGLTQVRDDNIKRAVINLSLPTVSEWMVQAAVQAVKGEEITYDKDTHFPMEKVTPETAQAAIDVWNGDI